MASFRSALSRFELLPLIAIYKPNIYKDIDIIFASSGTTACIAAGRLAKANPKLKILLIKGGLNTLKDPTVRNPVLFLLHLAPKSKTAIVNSHSSRYSSSALLTCIT
jgi:hypothetical protein